MKRSERIIADAKREIAISILFALSVVGIGAQVEPLAQQERVFSAFACVVAVFFLTVGCLVFFRNAVRLRRLSLDEAEHESRRETSPST